MRLRFTMCLLVLAPLACAKRKDAADLEVVRIAVHSRIAGSALHIADEEGFFRDEGIRLEFVETTRSSQALPVLERGDIDAIIGAASVGLYSALAKSIQAPDSTEKLNAIGVEPMVSANPQALARFIDSEFARWGQVVKAAGIKSE